MKQVLLQVLTVCVLGAAAALPATAEPMSVEAVLSPKEQMRLNFADGSKHFVLLVRREGQAEGSGPLAGAAVNEYGMHDIIPGVAGDPHGYLEFTAADGAKAYVKWLVRAVFVPNPGGKPKLLDYGHWELVGGTGTFAGMKGVGTLQIKPASKTDRRFILQGDLVPAP
jgi:hypothetical protein